MEKNTNTGLQRLYALSDETSGRVPVFHWLAISQVDVVDGRKAEARYA